MFHRNNNACFMSIIGEVAKNLLNVNHFATIVEREVVAENQRVINPFFLGCFRFLSDNNKNKLFCFFPQKIFVPLYFIFCKLTET